MKISILFLYLRMTPERSHKIAIYVLMSIIGAHFVAALFVSNWLPDDPLRIVDPDTCKGRDISMRADSYILD